MGLTNQIPSSRLAQAGVIPNAAARPASPYEGQMLFQLDTDQLLVWNGTAWVIPNQTTQNPVGLELIKSETLTSGNINTITGAFTNDYTNYKIVVSNLQANDVANMYMKMGTTATGYYYAGTRRSYAGTVTGGQGADTTQWVIGAVTNSTNKSGGTIELQMPQIAQRTTFQSSWGDSRTNGDGVNMFTGYLNNSTQYTSFTFFLDGAVTITSCTIKVYGYRD